MSRFGTGELRVKSSDPPSVVARTLKEQSIGPTTLIILAGVVPVFVLIVVVVNFVMCYRSRRRRRRWEKAGRKQRKDPELDSGEIREAVLTSHNTVQVEANSSEPRPSDTSSVIQDSNNNHNQSSRGHDRTSISVQLSRLTGSSLTDIGTPAMKKKFSRSSSMMRNDVGLPELEPGNEEVMPLETTGATTPGNQADAEENAEPLMTTATAHSSSDHHNEDDTETETEPNVDAEVDSIRRATLGSVTTYETLPSYHTRESRAMSSASFRSLPPLPPLQVPPLSSLPPLPLPFSPFTTGDQSARTSMRRSSSNEFESAVATPLPTEEDAASSSTTPGHEVVSDEAQHEVGNRDTMNSISRTSSETLPSYRTRGSNRNTRGA